MTAISRGAGHGASGYVLLGYSLGMSSERQLGVKRRPTFAPVIHGTTAQGHRMETTFPRLLLQHAAQRPGDAAMREKEYGIWQTRTWAQMAQLVEHIACGLHHAGLA